MGECGLRGSCGNARCSGIQRQRSQGLGLVNDMLAFNQPRLDRFQVGVTLNQEHRLMWPRSGCCGRYLGIRGGEGNRRLYKMAS